MRYLLLIIIFILSNFDIIKADNINITTLLDKSEIAKNYLYFKIKIDQPPNINVEIENWEKKLEYLQIIGKVKTDTTKKNKNISVKYIYKIFVPQNDTFEIPEINIYYKIGNNNFYRNTEPLKIYLDGVKKVNLDKKFKPIKKNQDMPITFREILPILLVTIGIISLILILVFWLKKRKENKQIVKIEKPKLPAHTIAITKLKKLEEQKLWQNEKIKKYHIILSEIIKEYIENRFNILSVEQTTNDLIDELKKTEIQPQLIELIQKTLNLSDLVKFAKLKPIAHQNQSCLDDIYKFIDKTRENIKEKE